MQHIVTKERSATISKLASPQVFRVRTKIPMLPHKHPASKIRNGAVFFFILFFSMSGSPHINITHRVSFLFEASFTAILLLLFTPFTATFANPFKIHSANEICPRLNHVLTPQAHRTNSASQQVFGTGVNRDILSYLYVPCNSNAKVVYHLCCCKK